MAGENTITTRSRSRLNVLVSDSTAYRSPRPTPQFFPGGRTFSTKKERGTPKNSLPPRPPIKSAPPVSRIFPQRKVRNAQVVSFRETTDKSFLNNSYNCSSRQTYFQQGFDVIETLGTGSFGQVFKVRCKHDGKYYAVKRSHDRFRGEFDRKRRVEEVAKYESLPPHMNCVRFYRAWEEREKLFIQMELCPYSLSQFAESNHRIVESTIWRYLVDLLLAIKHLHDHNLIHMDIKPENIFISNDAICKLGDFGLVIDLTKNIDLKNAEEGDPKYLAPELLQGKFGKPADIFSLGMTILELASDLDLPRDGEGWHQLREGHLPEEFLQGRSFDLKYVIRQMLHCCPATRPTAVELLAFPCVRKVLKRRNRDYVLKSVFSTIHQYFATVIHLLAVFIGILLYPLQQLHIHALKRVSQSVVPASVTSSSVLATTTASNTLSNTSSPFLDTSISDDECFNDDDVVTSPTKTALDTSSDSDVFCKPPPRCAFTTPGVRNSRPMRQSPLSSSPLATNASSYRGRLSPPNSLEDPLMDCVVERAATPTIKDYYNIGDDDEIKVAIEPKNLLEMFEAASDDEPFD